MTTMAAALKPILKDPLQTVHFWPHSLLKQKQETKAY